MTLKWSSPHTGTLWSFAILQAEQHTSIMCAGGNAERLDGKYVPVQGVRTIEVACKCFPKNVPKPP